MRFDHGQSDSRTLELETEMCNSVTSSGRFYREIFPETIILSFICVMTILIWTKSIRVWNHTFHTWHCNTKLRDPDMPVVAAETDTAPKSKDRSVVPTENQIRPCYSKPKVDPTIDIQTNKV